MPRPRRFAHAPSLLLSAIVMIGGIIAAFAQQPPVNAPTVTARILFTALDKQKNFVTTLSLLGFHSSIRIPHSAFFRVFSPAAIR